MTRSQLALALSLLPALAACGSSVTTSVPADEADVVQAVDEDHTREVLGDDDLADEMGARDDDLTDAPALDEEPAADADAATSATCDANAHTGDYCGGDKVSNGNSNTLYRCNGPGPATVKQSCAYGCVVAPSGYDDYCRAAPSPTCDADAHTGDYCGGDKVSNGSPNKLYHCNGPGPATLKQSCADGCVVAPSGYDDYCRVSVSDEFASCPHRTALAWGLAGVQSDHLRCAGVTSSRIMQTIGNASASAGTHAQDGTLGGRAYCAATDLSTSGMTNTQVRAWLSDMADQGVAAFFRRPGYDGWPSGEARHIHAIYVGVPMKASLRAQVSDWLAGKNGLASHTTYHFWQATPAQKQRIRALFEQAN